METKRSAGKRIRCGDDCVCLGDQVRAAGQMQWFRLSPFLFGLELNRDS